MLSLRSFKNNFTSGEITPWLQGRADIPAYVNGALTMENVLPRPQGGFRRRGGVRFVARAKYRDKECRLVPYRFSVTQAYMLELGEGYIRFFTNQGRLEQTATTVTNMADNGAGLIRVTAVAHGLVSNEFVALRGILGTTEANDDWQVTRINDDTYDLIGSTFTNPWVAGGTQTSKEIIEVVAPWQEADLIDFRFTQDQNAMFCVHPDYWPYLLTRTSPTVFVLTKLDNIIDAAENNWLGGPFQPWNDNPAHTMNWGSGTLTVGTASVMISSEAYFHADMVGMLFKYGGTAGTPAKQGYLLITAWNSTTSMDMTVVAQLSTTDAIDDWALGSWGEFSGFPSTVGFFEQRLVFANTATQPNVVWASAAGQEFNFEAVTGAAAEAWTVELFSSELNVIQWISSQKALLIGTEGAEFALSGGEFATTPSNILLHQQSAFGSAPQDAVKLGSTVVYVQRGGKRVFDLSYNAEEDKYLAVDLTLRAEHLFRTDAVKTMAFQLNPEPTTWYVTNGGQLVSMTLIKAEQVLSWAQHPVTGTTIESVGVVPKTTADTDDVWVAGAMTLNSGVSRYIGFIDESLFMDWGLSSTGSASSAFIGLDHLNGATVVINGDGAVYPPRVVVDGRITLVGTETPITAISTGLAFIPTVIPTSPEFDLPNGPSFGAKKRFTRLLLFASNTMSLAVNGEIYEPRTPAMAMDTAPVFAETSIFQFTTLGAEEILQLVITQPLPLGLDVTSLYGEVEIE